MTTLIKPARLRRGDAIGIFTPSFPAHLAFREKYLHGIREIERLGFRVIEGWLTQSLHTQGYRTATGRERAAELMELFLNSEVKGIVSTIGGSNSASILDHLDYELIRRNAKIFCGYSDVTSLHMGINKHAGVSTFYGPAVMPSFGEFPQMLPYTEASFLRALGVMDDSSHEREITPPVEWSNHIRDIPSGDWKTKERRFQAQTGWKTTETGTIEGPLLIANLSTLLSLIGTAHFPDLSGKVVVLEEMEAAFSQQERRWTQLRQSRVLEGALALLVGKPEVLKIENAPFSYSELIEETLEGLSIPRVYDFDCGHTSPMITLAQGRKVRIVMSEGLARLFVLESFVV